MCSRSRRARRRCGLAGIRVGEARVPGPPSQPAGAEDDDAIRIGRADGHRLDVELATHVCDGRERADARRREREAALCPRRAREGNRVRATSRRHPDSSTMIHP